jgi:hypothetical protein
MICSTKILKNHRIYLQSNLSPGLENSTIWKRRRCCGDQCESKSEEEITDLQLDDGGGSKNTKENQTTGMIVITDNFPLSSFILES